MSDLDTLDTLLGSGNYKRIARLTGLSRQHVGRVLNGRGRPSIRTASAISTAVGVDIDVLITFIESKRDMVTYGEELDETLTS